MNAPGLYVHIPFCLSKCPYFGFYSSTALVQVPDFLKALGKEMDIYRGDFSAFDTVYIGGGTPSVISVKDLAIILKGVADKFNVSPGAEITLEANPGDVSLTLLKDFRRLGINRLNLGIQSFDGGVLKFLGRRHSRSQAIEAIEAAVKAGFDSAGMDLIYGVPGQESKAWMDTLRLALSFKPAHLSCYELAIEPNTPFDVGKRKGNITPPDDETLADFFFKTSEVTESAGYIHYEVSNFARNKDLESRHNQKYWDHTPYLGLGPAAHSFDGRRRRWNHRSLSAYIKNMGMGIPTVEASEELTDEQLRLETLFLGLRTSMGVNLRDYRLRYGNDLLSEKTESISLLMERGLVVIKDGWLRPTLSGLAVADSLALI